jgi:membrane-associated phospholipid phosphatase
MKPVFRSSAVVTVVATALLLPSLGHATQTLADDTARATPPSSDARRPLHDLGGAFVDFGRDFWLAVSAPVRMDRGDWLTTAGVVAVGGVLVAFDEEIMRAALRNLDEPGFEQIDEVGTFLEPVGLMGKTNVYFGTAAIASWALGWERANRMFTEIMFSEWIAGMVRGATIKLVGRARPHNDFGAYHFSIGRGSSFPSGHASTIFQVATVLSHHARSTPVSILLYGLAGTVAWQRVTAETHWTSDVWLGAAYGWGVAKLVIRLHEEEALRVQPAVVPSGGIGLAFRYSF